MLLRRPRLQLLNSTAKRCLLHADAAALTATAAFDSEHLAAGSDPPAVDPERLTLYNMRFCMYAHRTVLSLLAKEIP